MWQVIGQDRAVAFLVNSIKKGQVSHAYLFVGPPHVGKRTLAMNLAQALNCSAMPPLSQAEGPALIPMYRDEGDIPCGECPQCRHIASGKHPDVVVIGLPTGPDGPQRKEISIDDVRDLRQAAYLRPFEGRCRVFIIDGAEYLSNEAANCLLKILEEPPNDVVLALTTAQETALLPTVRSRCQRVALERMSTAAVTQALEERWGAPHEQAEVIAPRAMGCLGWAVTALTDKRFLEEQDKRLAGIQEVILSGIEKRLAYSGRLGTQFPQHRGEVTETIKLWEVWWRDLMLVKEGCEAYLVNAQAKRALNEQAAAYSLSDIKDFLVRLREVAYHLDSNVNPRLALDVLMLSIPHPKTGRRETELVAP